MKAKIVKKLMAISLSLAMMATMVPVNATAAGIQNKGIAVTKETDSEKKESEAQKASETAASTEKETVKTYKTKIVLPGVKEKTKVKSLSVKQDGKEYKYDFKNLETSAGGELTLKLPANAKGKTTTVVINDVTFSGTVTDDDKAELKALASAKSTEASTEKNTEKSTEKATEKETDKKDEAAKTGKGIADDKLTISPITFEPVTYGYTERPAAKTLTITNTDSANSTQIKNVLISGDSFELKPESVSYPVDLTNTDAGNKFDKLTIQPKAGLKAASTYKATVTVIYMGLDTTGKDIEKMKSIEVSFTVNKKTLEVSFGVKGGISTFPYNGSNEVTVSAAVTGMLGADTDVNLKTKELTGTMTDANIGNNKAVTLSSSELAKLVLEGNNAGNYQLGSLNPEVKVSVTKAKITPSVKDYTESRTYSSGDKTIKGTISAEGIASKDKDKIEIKGKLELAKADAGTYTKIYLKDIELDGDKDIVDNYDCPESMTVEKDADGKNIEVEIKKADRTASPKKATIASYTSNTIKIKTSDDHEYAIVKSSSSDDIDYDELNWVSTDDTYYTFKKADKETLKASTTYKIISRYAETKNFHASKKADYEDTSATTTRTPIEADVNKLSIGGGISNNGTYKVSNRISFTAYGASTGMSSSVEGDVRYVPYSWTTDAGSSNTWTSSSSSTTTSQSDGFTPSKSGTFTLKVTYHQEKYDGSSWVNQNNDKEKSITFTVNSTGKTTTPNTNSGTNKNTSGVKTGDTSPIIPLVIVLVACVAVFGIVGVLGARKKKQRK